MINNIDDGDIKVYDPKNSKIPIASKVISKERSLIAIFNNGKIVKTGNMDLAFDTEKHGYHERG